MTEDLLRDFEPEIEQLTLVPSEGGRFEIVVNGRLLYSKLATGRHARSGEVLGLIKDYMKESAK